MNDDIGGLITFFMVIIIGLCVFIMVTRTDVISGKTFEQGNAVYKCTKINELVSER